MEKKKKKVFGHRKKGHKLQIRASLFLRKWLVIWLDQATQPESLGCNEEANEKISLQWSHH